MGFALVAGEGGAEFRVEVERSRAGGDAFDV